MINNNQTTVLLYKNRIDDFVNIHRDDIFGIPKYRKPSRKRERKQNQMTKKEADI